MFFGGGGCAGGGVIARAESFRPGSFSHLVLIEPIIFPPPFQRLDGPMSEGTRRRRRTFPSRDDAFERFASGPFGSWAPAALTAYIDHVKNSDVEEIFPKEVRLRQPGGTIDLDNGTS